MSEYLGQRKGLAVLGYGLSTLLKPLFVLATSPSWVLVARFGDHLGKGIRMVANFMLLILVNSRQLEPKTSMTLNSLHWLELFGFVLHPKTWVPLTHNPTIVY